MGSFLNALSFRYHTGIGMGGRSRCMSCGHALGARDLVPIVSYLYLRGRCRFCGSRIETQYPLVEIAAAFLGAATFFLYPQPVPFLFATLVWATVLFIVIYDLRHTVLPSGALGLVCALGAASLVFRCADICTVASPDLYALLAGPILGGPLLLLSFFSRGTWMGWGDGILMLGIGWVVGLPEGFLALLIAFWSGSLVGLGLMAWSRMRQGGKAGYTIRSAIPFAPFLALGALIAHALPTHLFSAILW